MRAARERPMINKMSGATLGGLGTESLVWLSLSSDDCMMLFIMAGLNTSSVESGWAWRVESGILMMSELEHCTAHNTDHGSMISQHHCQPPATVNTII